MCTLQMSTSTKQNNRKPDVKTSFLVLVISFIRLPTSRRKQQNTWSFSFLVPTKNKKTKLCFSFAGLNGVIEWSDDMKTASDQARTEAASAVNSRE